MSEPAVSVVIATYNWSSVLRYALRSVLAQTFQDFEVLVVGDACTDDSAEVVRSFDDPRVRWHNLPENSGTQSGPNNYGVRHARAPWIAYHGHDDLWHPRHLESLVEASRRAEADVWFALAVLIDPDGRRRLSGLHPGERYGEGDVVVPSSMMHRRSIFDEVGPWRGYQEVVEPPDAEWQQRAWRKGKRFAGTGRLTVFKFPASMRRDSYRLRESHEQAAFWRRLESGGGVVEEELVEVLRGALAQPDFRFRAPLQFAHAPLGWTNLLARSVRGLEPEMAPMQPLPESVTAGDLPLRISGAPASVTAGDRLALDVAIANLSAYPLTSHLPHPVHLAYRWLDAGGAVVVADGLRSVLDPQLLPGEERAYRCAVQVPETRGDHVLRVALVQEGVRWFDGPSEQGDRDLPVTVLAR
jgi:glycosyltransferase involved in cell wall biosynthesis